ncbi:hypothetical protein [Nonomuraea sp. SYSU D8015]|uniref:hypothetical protein n=1 Tax=Nonomuraea sp. SYSU D8015 TaxID=2593644 RepID=UPI001660EE70|nr:hypothetical protein [Nonomuraea sp. SYSU D8015]
MLLDALPEEEAVALLSRLVGATRIAAEPGAAAEVIRWCACLPLAVRVAGARLAVRPQWSVAAFAARLADAQRRLDELQLGDLRVRTSVAVSLAELRTSRDPADAAAAETFAWLGVPDGPDISVPAAARLLGQDESAAERSLDRLVDASLLDTPAPGRYRFHDLLRLLRPDDRRLPHARAEWTHDSLPLTDTSAALTWLDAERLNLLAAARQAADEDIAWTQRLRWAKANGLTPLQALRHWAGQQGDDRAGRVPADVEFELPTLRELEELAAE